MEPSTKRSFPSTDEEVVGFVKDAESIVQKLTGGTKEIDVISILEWPDSVKQLWQGRYIADKLRKSLIGRRYLIVLDDIWEVDVWEDLGLCFPKGEDGSRVMVTTRTEEVAKHLQHNSDPYSLRFLRLEESCELLQKKVFRGKRCPPDLRDVGLQVAQHCKGLPPVVVLIVGIIVKWKERHACGWRLQMT
uniref:Late blight resistance protein homolog R1A-3 n=1 Tax=Nicotiana sylvestris TaxID=4096 RepID=A0A1U7WEH1_NICSY|nr:PREDICTED: putative late blight resistance protein homolog R1A-3 [Nicotiana sylvestris]